nr:hypothetical protein [Micromonospora inositola]
MHPRHPEPCGLGQVLEPAGRGVPVHPHAEGVAQDRPAGAVVDGPVDGSGHRGWQRDEHDLATLAAHAQYPVAVLLAQVGDAGPAGFEDPQAERKREQERQPYITVRPQRR